MGHKGTILVVLAGLCMAANGAMEMARLYDKSLKAFSPTSSTVGWMNVKSNQPEPEHAIAVTEGGPLWCRASQNSQMLGGVVQEGRCAVAFLSKLYHLEPYEVLVSINGSTRLVNAPWDRLQSIPSQGIYTGNMILATAVDESGNTLAGYMNPKERRSYYVKGDKADRRDEANILTEVEPDHYEMDAIVIDDAKAKTETLEEVVAKITLENPKEHADTIQKNVDYTVEENVYYGRIKGTIVGHKAAVTNPAGVKQDLVWGTENMLEHVENQLVQYELPAKAGVHIQLVSIMKKLEAPYSASLKSVFEDGVRMTRNIEGLHIHKYMAELRAKFSAPFYLSNNSEIIGEIPKSEILMHSTTTTTTTTTTSSPESPNTAEEKPQSDNSITDNDIDEKIPEQKQPLVDPNSGTTNIVSQFIFFNSICLSIFFHFLK